MNWYLYQLFIILVEIQINDIYIPSEECSRYLGIKIDRALTFKKHLEGLKNKLKTRNNIISKLAESTWGNDARVLHVSRLTLLYSVAEYCAPVWFRSSYCKKVDTELNQTMRIITGTIRTTEVQWLPVW